MKNECLDESDELDIFGSHNIFELCLAYYFTDADHENETAAINERIVVHFNFL